MYTFELHELDFAASRLVKIAFRFRWAAPIADVFRPIGALISPRIYPWEGILRRGNQLCAVRSYLLTAEAAKNFFLADS
jgi:hypothetical protein